jgi:YgiT-type zinc finger domain-containing protein
MPLSLQVIMNCHICGGEPEKITSDLPFKRGGHSIVILKDLPVLQCDNCSEFH